jgi:hypothetical protein
VQCEHEPFGEVDDHLWPVALKRLAEQLAAVPSISLRGENRNHAVDQLVKRFGVLQHQLVLTVYPNGTAVTRSTD